MISDLWQIETAASSPSDAATLTSLGVTGARVKMVQQQAGELVLHFADEASALDAAEIWAWETRLTLLRDSVAVWQGRVASSPGQGDGRSESRSVTLRDVWWDLDRTLFLQPWTSQTPSGEQEIDTSRCILGYDPVSRTRETVAEALAEVVSYATTAGVTLTLDTSGLRTGYLPPIIAHNRTCGDLLRAILRWEPEASAVLDYHPTTGAPTLRVYDRANVPARDVAVTACTSVKVTSRPDLVPDSVHVLYETQARAPEVVDTDTAVIQAPRKLVVARDIHPAGSSVTRSSMVVTLPGPVQPEYAAPQQPQPHLQPVQTRVLPASGAYDNTAERWWLEHSGFGALGLTIDDIRLPTSTTADVIAHRIQFADEDGVDDPPPTINPNATPVFKPTTLDDLPRELVSGQLAEWMNVKWAEVIADVTMALRQSTVDSLPESDRRVILAMAPRTAQVQGVDAYLVDVQARITATDAVTKTYKQWPTTNPGGIASSGDAGTATNQAAAEAIERAIVPGLARKIYEARSVTPYEGDLTLTAVDIPREPRYLGRALNLYGDRAAWASMRAIIQREEWDIAAGETRLGYGPPEQLEPQDWLALHTAAIDAQRARSGDASTPQRPDGAIDPPVDPDADDDEPTPAIFGPNKGPLSQFAVRGGGGSDVEEPWRVTATDGGASIALVISPGDILDGAGDRSSVLTCTNPDASFTVADGGFLVAELTAFEPSDYTLAYHASWPVASSQVVETSLDTDDVLQFEALYYPLWSISATAAAFGAHAIGDGLWANRLVPREHLRVVYSVYAPPDGADGAGQRIVVPTLEVSHAALPSA